MTAKNNANPGAEIKVDGTSYPDEVKRSYRETFLTRHNLKPYKYVGCTMSLWQRLKRIVTNIGGERASVGMYVQNIVAYHLEDEDVKPLIALSRILSIGYRLQSNGWYLAGSQEVSGEIPDGRYGQP